MVHVQPGKLCGRREIFRRIIRLRRRCILISSMSQLLDRVLVRCLVWWGSLKWLARLIGWVSTILVVRLLSPEDYGLVAMAGVYFVFAKLIFEFGLGASVVTKSLDSVQLAQVNSVSLFLGVFGFILSALIAEPLAAFYGTPDLFWVVVVMAVSFLLSGLRTVPTAILERELRFEFLAVIETVQVLFQACCSLWLAMKGFHYWTLIISGLAGECIITVAVLVKRGHTFLLPNVHVIHAFVFGSHVVLSRLFWSAQMQSQFLVAGRLLGSASLGVYSIAWSLSSLMVEHITATIGRVTFPFFSTIQHDPHLLRRYYLVLVEGLSLTCFAAELGMALVAEEFVPVILGPRWLEVIHPIQVLAIAAIIRTIDPLLPQILFVSGEIRFQTIMMGIAAIVLPTGFFLGSQWGLSSMALTWLVLFPLVSIPVYYRVFHRLQISMEQFAQALWPASSACFLMAVAVLSVKAVLPSEFPMWTRLAVEVFVGAAMYGLTLFTLFRDRLLTFWRILVPTKNENNYAWVPPATLAMVPETLQTKAAPQVAPPG